MAKRRCLFCNVALDWNDHGNRNYCNEECYDAGKKLRNIKKYRDNKAEQEGFQKVDLILKRFYELYGSDRCIPAILLDEVEMAWLIRKNEIIINGRPAIPVGLYAYNLYNNATVQIWKLQ